MNPALLQTVRGILLGATIGSLLMLAGYTVRDRTGPTPSLCRDSFRRITPQDEGLSCPYAGQTALFIDIDGKPGLLCQCHPAPPVRNGSTVLL